MEVNVWIVPRRRWGSTSVTLMLTANHSLLALTQRRLLDAMHKADAKASVAQYRT